RGSGRAVVGGLGGGRLRRFGVGATIDGAGVVCRHGVRDRLGDRVRGRVGVLRGGACRAGLPGGGQPPKGALVRAVERLGAAGVLEYPQLLVGRGVGHTRRGGDIGGGGTDSIAAARTGEVGDRGGDGLGGGVGLAGGARFGHSGPPLVEGTDARGWAGVQ